MSGYQNSIRKENYNQVCVWEGTIVGPEKIREFEKFMMEQFEVRAQYLEELKTKPDKGVKGTGGRNDLFFAVHDEDVDKFSVPRLGYGIRWIEDVLSKENYKIKIYPLRVNKYKIW
jgi:hypothetical protein